jgi:hypothetical protein
MEIGALLSRLAAILPLPCAPNRFGASGSMCLLIFAMDCLLAPFAHMRGA